VIAKQAPLFKYVSEERFAQSLIERGEVFMQTLANFRGYEDNDVRRDPDDGRLRYQPLEGLPINFEGKEPTEPWKGWRLTSSVKEEDVYVYCLSTEKSAQLAKRFESPFCVEIYNPTSFVGRIRRSVRLRSQLERRQLYFGSVDYRSLEVVPTIDWALPEKIALIKPEAWAWQNEFRIVVGKKDAFDVENVRMTLETGLPNSAPINNHPPLMLSLGDLSRHSRMHKF
jgi:hypothetical protein